MANPEQPSASMAPASANGPNGHKPLRILIVDDDPASRRLLIRTMQDDYDVVECQNGAETLQLLEGDGPALVVLDYQMPDLNGAQVCELVRSSPDFEVAQSPIIMLTGFSNSTHEIECLQAGADDFVTKPVNMAVLRARIDTHRRLHAMRKELLAQKTELEKWRVRHEEDMEAARVTQQAILPQRRPPLDGWSYEANYRPLMQIGGDIYDWFKTPDGALLVWISDATGHGASAALLTTLSKLMFRHAIAESHQPSGVMDFVEREFQGVFRGHSFMTAGCLRIEPGQGTVTFCGAGQPPLLIARASGHVESIRASRPPLGLNKTDASIEERCELAPGDALLLYTDGLYDIHNLDGERLGADGLAKILPTPRGDATTWLAAIMEKVGRFGPASDAPDDIAAVAAMRTEGATAIPPLEI